MDPKIFYFVVEIFFSTNPVRVLYARVIAQLL